MMNNSLDAILLLRDIYQDTYFNEEQLHVITAVILILGAFLNVTLIFVSVSRVNQGITSNIITIAFLDILNLMLLLPEIVYVNNRNWKFSNKLCTVYLGIECMINICLFYTTIMTNLQVISAIHVINRCYKVQLDKSTVKETEYDSFDDSSEVDDEGYEILGNGYVETRATPSPDFIHKGSFLVLFTLVVTLATSVSVPFFMYAQKERIPGMDSAICVMKGLNDPMFNHIIAILVIFVRILLPSVLLVGTTVMLLIKHYKGSHVHFLGKSVKIALILSIILILFSLQRAYVSLLFEIYSTENIGNNKPFTQFKYPHVGSNLLAILLTLTHYLSSLVRPFSLLLLQHCCAITKQQVSVGKDTTAIKTINKTLEV